MDLQEQLPGVERKITQLRVAVAVLAVVVCVLAGGLAMVSRKGQPKPPSRQQTLVASSFRLVDSDGRTRGEFSAGTGGPELVLRDENGNAKAAMMVSPDLGATLVMLGESGKTFARLSETERGPALSLIHKGTSDQMALTATGLAIYDENGRQRVRLTMSNASPWGPGFPGLLLYDEKGRRRLGLTIQKDAPALELRDSRKELRVLLSSERFGPRLLFCDSKGNWPMWLEVRDGKPELVVCDEAGQAIWTAPK
jgi:hypothetical protein